MSRMEFRRPPGAIALVWLATTALGVAAGWVGLRPVLDAAVPDRAAPLSAADVRHLAVPPNSPASPPAPTGFGTGSSGPPTASGGTSPSATPSASATRTRAGSPATAAPVVDGWTVTTQADGTVSYLRGFQVRGGSVVIRMVPGRVFLVSATPNPDHSVTTGQTDPTRLVVQFTAPSRYDIVDAMWWNDRPYAQVSAVG